jgi:hypothetical protein
VSIEDGQPMSEARVLTPEGIYRSRLEDRIRMDLALAPQGWEPVQAFLAPEPIIDTDAFQAGDRPPPQSRVPLRNAWDRIDEWIMSADLRGAFRAVVSLLLGAAIVLLLLLAYQADPR